MNQKRLFLNTGRIGDICNSLPLALRYFEETGIRPFYMVAAQFKNMLDGVSYVDPVVFNGPFENCIGAMYEARKLTADIALCQIYGMGISFLELETSFVRESWVSAGASHAWGTLPLVFDRRNAVREDLLRGNLLQRAAGRKIVLLALSGISSPFPYGKQLHEYLKGFLPDSFYLVDLEEYRTPYFFDFLGMLEVCHCLVSVDTGFLHLAAALKTPTVSLINPSPSKWHGSAWRSHHVARFFYHEFPKRNGEVVSAVTTARNFNVQPKIIHTFADWREIPDPDAERRKDIARESWEMEDRFASGRWIRCELRRGKDGAFPDRRSGMDIGDPAPVPYIRDMITHALPYADKGSDIIGWTNADICFAPGLTGEILDVCSRKGAAFCQRWDFPRLVQPFTSTGMVRRGAWYPGCDAFFFTVAWWKEHGNELPDLLIGREKVDQTFRQLIKYYHGGEIHAGIYHEKHASFWEQPVNFVSNPGNNHNRALARKWAESIGVGDNDHIWWTEEANRLTRR